MAWLIGTCLILFVVVCGVWLFKVFFELLNILCVGVVFSFAVIGSAMWGIARGLYRAVRCLLRRVWPAVARLLDWLCVYVAIAGIWLWFHFRRLYVRKELKDRQK